MDEWDFDSPMELASEAMHPLTFDSARGNGGNGIRPPAGSEETGRDALHEDPERDLPGGLDEDLQEALEEDASEMEPMGPFEEEISMLLAEDAAKNTTEAEAAGTVRPTIVPVFPRTEEILPDTTVRAGDLTRGRKRDLDSGATSLKTVETLKIVYWGPGRSGKTTNLTWLHDRLRPELRGRLVSLDTPGERTLYFDCLPLDLVQDKAAPVQLRLYTVPGQPRFRLTRKLVLDGVDGVVFVWDSRSRRLNANLASLIEMRETMAELGVSWSQVPRIVQYNKLDLPDAIPPEQMHHVLDRMGERVPRLHAIATQGVGVLDTLRTITTAAVKLQRVKGDAPWYSAAGF